MLNCIIRDLRRYVPAGKRGGVFGLVVRVVATMILHPGWLAVFNFRLAQFFYRVWLFPVGWLLYRLNMHLFAIDMHPGIRIGPGLWLPHPFGIVINRRSSIGADVTIFQNVTIGDGKPPYEIGDRVVLGAGSCLLGPIKLGSDIQVGANAVVTKSFEGPGSLMGVPASMHHLKGDS